MRRGLRGLLLGITRFVLSLRYRVELTGADRLADLEGPVLVLPNHPGYIDPALVLTHVRPATPLRPLVYSGTYRFAPLYPLMKVIDAFEVPEMDRQSRGSKEATHEMIEAAVAAIANGDNLLIYPSGRLQREGAEVVGAARVAHEIVSARPEVSVVLVRTRGVWGSMFSFAPTGTLPNLGLCLLRAVWYFMASLLFFLPRRRITMHVEVVDRATLPLDDRLAFNTALEQWYNAPGPESPTFVPYHHLLSSRTFDFPRYAGGGDVDLATLDPHTVEAVLTMIEEHLGRPLDESEKSGDIALDRIGLDSLDRMDVALAIEDRFGFRSDDVAGTIGELCALADGSLPTTTTDPKPTPADWSQAPPRTTAVGIEGETVPEAFVRRMLAAPTAIAAADETAGVLDARRLLTAVELFARRMGGIEAENIGLLLPASVAADIAFLSVGVAGRTPVMLNWTTGAAGLAHAVRTTDLTHVVTSRRIVDRLGLEIEGAEFLFLEDLGAGISRWERLLAHLGTRLRPNRLIRRLPPARSDAPAAILFTSGSESAPKAVPLSHRNLLANARASLAALEADHNDSLLGFLPPFHSFGLTGNLLMPLLGGIPVVHSPDPTAARQLKETVARYRLTMLFSTPTFLNYLLAAAEPDDLDSLRLLVTGAERTPEALFEDCRRLVPGASLLEGYGITECSPVVSCNRPRAAKPGTVGRPLDNVDVSVRDLESGKPLPNGESGMIFVAGPSIFAGYHRFEGDSPFESFDGRDWYRTGDLGRFDDEGYLTITGRLKRFLKCGGEMISLPALEHPLAAAHPADEHGPRCAVEGIETPDGRHIVLFTREELTLRDANAILADAGFRGIMRFDAVRRVEAIPTLGTGKTDYRRLRELILATRPALATSSAHG